jgi:hypothetical protein
VLGRARYLKALAKAARRTDVRAVAERLHPAHSATVEWISTVLAEEALGGPAALRATSIQRATGGATRTISRPVRAARESVNHIQVVCELRSSRGSDPPWTTGVTAPADQLPARSSLTTSSA